MLLPVMGQGAGRAWFTGRLYPDRLGIPLHLHCHLTLFAYQYKGLSKAGCNLRLAEGALQQPCDIVGRLIFVQIAVKCLLSRLFLRLEYQPALHEQWTDSGPGDYAAVCGVAHKNPLQRLI